MPKMRGQRALKNVPGAIARDAHTAVATGSDSFLVCRILLVALSRSVPASVCVSTKAAHQ